MTRIIMFMGLLCLVACQNSTHRKATDSTPSLTFKDKTESFEECVGEACAKVALAYPVFEGDSVLAEIINRQIAEQNISMWVTGDQQYSGMEEAVSSFFDGYKSFRTDFPDAPQEWTFETEAKVTHQSDSLVSIRFENFSYLGGAHPNTVVIYLNLDLSQEANMLVHEKMLIDRERLLELAEEKFREHHEVDQGLVWKKMDGFFWTRGSFFFRPPWVMRTMNSFCFIMRTRLALMQWEGQN